MAATTESDEDDNAKTERKTIIKLKYNEKEIDNKMSRGNRKTAPATTSTTIMTYAATM